MPADAEVLEATRRWIAQTVIGLNLCPFARRVFEAGTIRYVVSTAADEQALLKDLAREIERIAVTPIDEVETTLLIHPRALRDFSAFTEFLGAGERLLAELGMRGVVQIASFHPDYQFADAAPEAVENYTNRSPYPILHLLREESIAAIAAPEEELLEIPRRNVATLRALGIEKLREMTDYVSRPKSAESPKLP
jgi:uncharacterized protein